MVKNEKDEKKMKRFSNVEEDAQQPSQFFHAKVYVQNAP